MTNDTTNNADATSYPDLSLIEFMTVEPTDDPELFIGRSERCGMFGIYGGHYLGQALAAALQTVYI